MREDDEDYDLTEEEFARWLPPGDALSAVRHRLLPDKAKPLILKRIEDEELFVAARKVRVTVGIEEKHSLPFRRLSKKWWRDGRRGFVADGFWTTGDIRFTEPSTTSFAGAVVLSCVEIRFDPEGVANLLPKPPALPATPQYVPLGPPGPGGIPPPLDLDLSPKSPPLRKRANPVTDGEIKAWYANLSETDQSLGVAALWAKAQEDHPGRHLPRKLVDPFGVARSNGHRAMK